MKVFFAQWGPWSLCPSSTPLCSWLLKWVLANLSDPPASWTLPPHQSWLWPSSHLPSKSCVIMSDRRNPKFLEKSGYRLYHWSCFTLYNAHYVLKKIPLFLFMGMGIFAWMLCWCTTCLQCPGGQEKVLYSLELGYKLLSAKGHLGAGKGTQVLWKSNQRSSLWVTSSGLPPWTFLNTNLPANVKLKF